MAQRYSQKSIKAKLTALAVAVLFTVISLALYRLGIIKELPDLPLLDELGISVETVSSQPTQAPTGELKVCYLDVDQGDSILIMAPEANVLIDAGTPGQGSTVYSALNELGINELDYIINTHPHSDHVGGLGKVVKTLGKGNIGQVLLTTYPEELEPVIQSWVDFLQRSEENGAQISTAEIGQVLNLGDGATITIMGPAKLYDDMNDTSIICRLDYGEASFLFAGDSGIEAIRDSQELGGNLEADILMLGHHGSSTSTDSMVLRMVDPKAAIASCGVDNDYGHPHREVTELLEDEDIPCLRTDLQGNIWATTDGETISFTTERGQQDALLINAA